MSCSTFEPFDDFWLGCPKHIVDAMDLIKFIPAWEQGHLRYEFEQDTTESPNIHLLIIVTVRHEAFGCSIPPCGYVFGVGLLAVSPCA